MFWVDVTYMLSLEMQWKSNQLMVILRKTYAPFFKFAFFEDYLCLPFGWWYLDNRWQYDFKRIWLWFEIWLSISVLTRSYSVSHKVLAWPAFPALQNIWTLHQGLNFQPNSGLRAAGWPVGRAAESHLIQLSHWLLVQCFRLIGWAVKGGPCAPRSTPRNWDDWNELITLI